MFCHGLATSVGLQFIRYVEKKINRRRLAVTVRNYLNIDDTTQVIHKVHYEVDLRVYEAFYLSTKFL